MHVAFGDDGAKAQVGREEKLTLSQGAVMLILKAVLLGLAVFLVGAMIYMFLGSFLRRKLIRARGIDVSISSKSPFLWIGFVGSLVVGYFLSIRGLWILQGVLLGGAMFIVGTLGYGIAYNRRLQKLYPQPPGASVGINVGHLWLKLFAALICSVGLGLAIARIWPPTRGVPVR